MGRRNKHHRTSDTSTLVHDEGRYQPPENQVLTLELAEQARALGLVVPEVTPGTTEDDADENPPTSPRPNAAKVLGIRPLPGNRFSIHVKVWESLPDLTVDEVIARPVARGLTSTSRKRWDVIVETAGGAFKRTPAGVTDDLRGIPRLRIVGTRSTDPAPQPFTRQGGRGLHQPAKVGKREVNLLLQILIGLGLMRRQ